MEKTKNCNIADHVESLDYRYLHDEKFQHILQSGLLFIAKGPISVALPSSQLEIQCLAPKFFRNRLSKMCCSKKIADIGPYCRDHSILYHNLEVKPSNIDQKIRGLFASVSTLNVAEIRHVRSNCTHETVDTLRLRHLTPLEYSNYMDRKVPLFLQGDLIAPFGGMLSIFEKNENSSSDQNNDESTTNSYIIEFSDDKNLRVLMDGFIESSGLARFANSVIESSCGRSIGEEYFNAEMVCINIEATPVSVGKHFVRKIPCLIARKNIFHGEEIITNYGAQYWTVDFINSLPKEKADYLNAKTDKNPNFFEQK